MITQEDDLATRHAGLEAQAQFRKFMFKFGVMPCAGLAGLGFLMGLTGANDHSGWPGVFLIALGLVFGGIAGLICLTASPGRPAIQRRHKGGAQISRIDAPMDAEGVPLGNVRMPEHLESLHMLIEGATGTGKTQLLKNMVAHLRARGDTVVVVDTNYDMWTAFNRPDDVILSPFDPAFPGWLPMNEVRAPSDWSALAQSFIGDGVGEAAQWHQMAKAMFSATARGYQRIVEEAGDTFDHKELFHLLTGADAEASRSPTVCRTRSSYEPQTLSLRSGNPS